MCMVNMKRVRDIGEVDPKWDIDITPPFLRLRDLLKEGTKRW